MFQFSSGVEKQGKGKKDTYKPIILLHVEARQGRQIISEMFQYKDHKRDAKASVFNSRRMTEFL